MARWTKEEINTLYKHYPTGGYKKIQEYLPNRSKQAIIHKAWRLGIKVLYRPERYANGPKKHSLETKQKMSRASKGHVKWSEWRRKIGRPGPLHWNWIDGRSYKEYPSAFSKALRREIRTRDRNMCRLCGTRPRKRNLPVHHIDHNKDNNNEENLISLCLQCHCDYHNSNEEAQIILYSLFVNLMESNFQPENGKQTPRIAGKSAKELIGYCQATRQRPLTTQLFGLSAAEPLTERKVQRLCTVPS